MSQNWEWVEIQPLLVIPQNVKTFLTKKHYENVKITKLSCAYKGYASTSNADILNCFNPELELKNTESAIKNKLKDLLN